MNRVEITKKYQDGKKLARVEHKKANAATNNGPMKVLYHERAVLKEEILAAELMTNKAALHKEHTTGHAKKLEEIQKLITKIEAEVLKKLES